MQARGAERVEAPEHAAVDRGAGASRPARGSGRRGAGRRSRCWRRGTRWARPPDARAPEREDVGRGGVAAPWSAAVLVPGGLGEGEVAARRVDAGLAEARPRPLGRLVEGRGVVGER